MISDSLVRERLWIGQAGIRKITAKDFETIRNVYHQRRNPHEVDYSRIVVGEKVVAEEEPILLVAEFTKMQDLIQEALSGETIYTPSGKPNIIIGIIEKWIDGSIKSKRDGSVLGEWIQGVYDKLCELGSIERTDLQKGDHSVKGGFRSAFIFGLLARFNHICRSKQTACTASISKAVTDIQLLPVGYFPAEVMPVEREVWTEEEIVARFQGIRVWRKGDRIAPHKPLLLLYAIARCKQNDSRQMPYSKIDKDLTWLLRRFNLQSHEQRTEDPFWRLQNDGLWEIPDAHLLQTSKTSTPNKDELLRHD